LLLMALVASGFSRSLITQVHYGMPVCVLRYTSIQVILLIALRSLEMAKAVCGFSPSLRTQALFGMPT